MLKQTFQYIFSSFSMWHLPSIIGKISNINISQRNGILMTMCEGRKAKYAVWVSFWGEMSCSDACAQTPSNSDVFKSSRGLVISTITEPIIERNGGCTCKPLWSGQKSIRCSSLRTALGMVSDREAQRSDKRRSPSRHIITAAHAVAADTRNPSPGRPWTPAPCGIRLRMYHPRAPAILTDLARECEKRRRPCEPWKRMHGCSLSLPAGPPIKGRSLVFFGGGGGGTKSQQFPRKLKDYFNFCVY